MFDHPRYTLKKSTARGSGQLCYYPKLVSSQRVTIRFDTKLVGCGHQDTERQVINLLESALGKVLLIEGCRLALDCSTSMYYREAVGELLNAMTQERYARKLVIILAGYTDEMNPLLKLNPGLRGGFPTPLRFPSMSPKSCLKHLSNQVNLHNLRLIPLRLSSSKAKVDRHFTKLSQTPGWASGRDVETLATSVVRAAYIKERRRGKDEGSGTLVVTPEELIEQLQEMLKERKALHADETKQRTTE